MMLSLGMSTSHGYWRGFHAILHHAYHHAHGSNTLLERQHLRGFQRLPAKTKAIYCSVTGFLPRGRMRGFERQPQREPHCHPDTVPRSPFTIMAYLVYNE